MKASVLPWSRLPTREGAVQAEVRPAQVEAGHEGAPGRHEVGRGGPAGPVPGDVTRQIGPCSSYALDPSPPGASSTSHPTAWQAATGNDTVLARVSVANASLAKELEPARAFFARRRRVKPAEGGGTGEEAKKAGGT
jgi:hypothetical protein